MACTSYIQSIQEVIDGTLGPIRRAELEQHLEQCGECRALLEDLRVVHDTAASLEPLAPPDGVWLQIAGRLRQEGRVAAPPPQQATRARTYQVAVLAIAAALVLSVAASLLWLYPAFQAGGNGDAATASGAASQPGGNASADLAVQGVEEEFRLAEQHYQNAIAKLEEAARLNTTSPDANTLDPQTAAVLQKNLQVIDQAIAESRAALRGEPQSVVARDSLFGALRRKVTLLQDTIALMNEMRKGNSAGAAQLLNKS